MTLIGGQLKSQDKNIKTKDLLDILLNILHDKDVK